MNQPLGLQDLAFGLVASRSVWIRLFISHMGATGFWEELRLLRACSLVPTQCLLSTRYVCWQEGMRVDLQIQKGGQGVFV